MPGPYLPGERLYRTLVILGGPLKRWCRLEVRGLELLREPGGVLLVSNHDSWLDPLALGESCMRVRRPLRFLAKASLWNTLPLRLLLDGIRQIPIQRGAGDLAALEVATSALSDGEAICIFIEGTLSRGRRMRARRGVGRLAEAAPDARIVLAAVHGGTALARFPERPRVLVEYFAAAGGPMRTGEDQAAFAARLLAEIRERVPPVAAGRRPRALPDEADAAAATEAERYEAGR